MARWSRSKAAPGMRRRLVGLWLCCAEALFSQRLSRADDDDAGACVDAALPAASLSSEQPWPLLMRPGVAEVREMPLLLRVACICQRRKEASAAAPSGSSRTAASTSDGGGAGDAADQRLDAVDSSRRSATADVSPAAASSEQHRGIDERVAGTREAASSAIRAQTS